MLSFGKCYHLVNVIIWLMLSEMVWTKVITLSIAYFICISFVWQLIKLHALYSCNIDSDMSIAYDEYNFNFSRNPFISTFISGYII